MDALVETRSQRIVKTVNFARRTCPVDQTFKNQNGHMRDYDELLSRINVELQEMAKFGVKKVLFPYDNYPQSPQLNLLLHPPYSIHSSPYYYLAFQKIHFSHGF